MKVVEGIKVIGICELLEELGVDSQNLSYDEETEYFKKVYDDNTPLGIYQSNIIGPIRIWEVNYPEDIQPDEFYLQSSEYG